MPIEGKPAAVETKAEKHQHAFVVVRSSDFRTCEQSAGESSDSLIAHPPCKSSKDHSKPRNEVDTSLKSPV